MNTEPMSDERLDLLRRMFAPVLEHGDGRHASSHYAAELIREVELLRAALDRVRLQHFPVDGVYADAPVVCGNRYCNDDATDQFPWPCPTVRAINGD